MGILLSSVLSTKAQEKYWQHQHEALKYSGSYSGLLPCSECPGIETKLELTATTDSSGTYILRSKYKVANITSVQTGEWIIVKLNVDQVLYDIIVLDYTKEEGESYYIIESNGELAKLDEDMHRLENYKKHLLKKEVEDLINK